MPSKEGTVQNPKRTLEAIKRLEAELRKAERECSP